VQSLSDFLTERCEIWDHVSSNSIPPYLRTIEPTSYRQPTAPATTANSVGAPPSRPGSLYRVTSIVEHVNPPPRLPITHRYRKT
jgi:hypothetical protein